MKIQDLKDPKEIAQALQSGQAPQGLSIDLRWETNIGSEGANIILSSIEDSIKKGSLPYGLKIDGVSEQVSTLLESYNTSVLKRNNYMCDFFNDSSDARTSTVKHFNMPKDMVDIISSFSIFKAPPKQPATFDEQEESKQAMP